MNQEWMSMQAHQLKGANAWVLPMRLPGGYLPFLADLEYPDLAADWQGGVYSTHKSARGI